MGAKNKKIHISAGAVVVREGKKGTEVLVMHRKATQSWHLPKGTVESGESILDTALREVEEETGVRIAVDRYLGQLRSKKEDGAPKITHYYLAHPLSLDFSQHDREHDEVKFLPEEEAYFQLKAQPLFEREFELFDKYLR